MTDTTTSASRIIAGLASSDVVQVRVGFDVQLVVDAGILQIESQATLSVDGQTVVMSASGDPTRAAAALSLLRTTVGDVQLEGGILRAHFSSGALLEVEPDEQYEAWSWTGSDGGRVVCMPGGELAVWGSTG